MKLYKLLTLVILFWFCVGCQIDAVGPYTGTKYSAGVNAEDGIFIKAKPFGWDSIIKLLTNP